MLSGQIAFDGSRTPLKTILFLLVCAAWILPGLVGHDPWKTDDAVVLGLVFEMLRTGETVVFSLAGEPFLERPPLYIWLAGLSARLFGGFLPFHDAARLVSGFLMAGTLAFLAGAARELLGERAMRLCVLLFIGCLGLLIRAHELTSDLAGLLGVALAIYGLALALRRPRWGGVATGLGLGIAFLGDGFLPIGMLLLLMGALPVVHPAWRTRDYATTAVLAIACAAPLAAVWPLVLWMKSPGWLTFWLESATSSRWSSASPGAMLSDLVYFLRILPWYAWPAWPLAAWSIWRSRRMLAARKGVVLPLTALAAFFLVLTLFADTREVNALPILVPLALLGVAEIDSLPRGGASALDWFGTTTFFLFAAVIWLAWVAVMTGRPEGVLAWLKSEVPGFTYSFSFIAFALAMLLTLIWLAVIARSLRSPRRALVNWAAGITMIWTLVMTLGVPLVDQARSYRAVSANLVRALPPQFGCIASRNLGEAQRAVLDYFVALRTFRLETPAASRCRALLVQASQKSPAAAPEGWQEIWRGSRPGDRNEAFVLYGRETR